MHRLSLVPSIRWLSMLAALLLTALLVACGENGPEPIPSDFISQPIALTPAVPSVEADLKAETEDDEKESPHVDASSVTSVGAGFDHTCAVRIDSSVVCWGLDEDGQASPPAGSFTSVSSSRSHGCVLRDDGAVQCWGWP